MNGTKTSGLSTRPSLSAASDDPLSATERRRAAGQPLLTVSNSSCTASHGGTARPAAGEAVGDRAEQAKCDDREDNIGDEAVKAVPKALLH